MIITLIDITKIQKYNCFIVNPPLYNVDLQIDDEFFAKIKNY